jgi:hypothetical protein
MHEWFLHAPAATGSGITGLTRAFGGHSCQVLSTGGGHWSTEAVRFRPPVKTAVRSGPPSGDFGWYVNGAGEYIRSRGV